MSSELFYYVREKDEGPTFLKGQPDRHPIFYVGYMVLSILHLKNNPISDTHIYFLIALKQ